eukprot:TRINITY_DN2743_c0_g1_i1.p1 TRINITY_DN2743_c0_g1~~TRINITY_DN2743_c0_g1_i1.p1  ORF type:complete len:524 (-),score=111.28 TRINITY_DN2743_c0_g1_i1:59-1498(-)
MPPRAFVAPPHSGFFHFPQSCGYARPGVMRPPVDTVNGAGLILIVTGCKDTTVGGMIHGAFAPCGENHGRNVWRKATKVKDLDALIFFWDSRDGLHLHGWWIGPVVGGDVVWAYNPGQGTAFPPMSGWKVPFDGPVQISLTVTRSQSNPRTPGGVWVAQQPTEVPEVVRQPRLVDAELVDKRLDELRSLADKADASYQSLKLKAKELDGDETMADDDAVRISSDVEGLGFEVKTAQKKCSDFLLAQRMTLGDLQKPDFVKLVARLTTATRDAGYIYKRASRIHRQRKDQMGKRVKKVAALKHAKKQSDLFAKYDADGDGLLRAEDVVRLVREEHNFELSSEKLVAIMTTLGSADGEADAGASDSKEPASPVEVSAKLGIPVGNFARLRSMVGVAREEARARQRRLEREEQERKQLEAMLSTADPQEAKIAEGEEAKKEESAKQAEVEEAKKEESAKQAEVEEAKKADGEAADAANGETP